MNNLPSSRLTKKQVWNRPYANTAVNQAVNLLNRNSRSNPSYSLTQHQPPTDVTTEKTLQNNNPSQGEILNSSKNNDPAILYSSNCNSRINPFMFSNDVTTNSSYHTPPYVPSSSVQASEPYLTPTQPNFPEISPPSMQLPQNSDVSNIAPTFDGRVNSYSNIHVQQQPFPIDPAAEPYSPPISEAFVEVLPSEITCPACILQVKHKRTCRIFREVLFYLEFTLLSKRVDKM